ncbi:MAG: undecaprenyldiphospho-muramoylpentapeptide beta-N-acetylglucosaminyltransferase [Acidobacteriota bacterium]|nr:undecaprenyldiphospho-muramoylpentapeptide beta-N-acetylglucosaminyltransferase [Acidobacteriota bacterium]
MVIAAGGTAGHVSPALAVARALRARGAAVTFVGGDRAEAEMVPAAGFPIVRLAVEGLSRRNPLRALRALWRAAIAFVRARRLLGDLRPAAVFGGGGYVAGPVGLAALSAGVPLVLSEADSHLGLANRLLAARARRVCLAFPIDGREGDPYRVTGRPLPFAPVPRDRARERFGVARDAVCVLVFGGSLGSRAINLAAIAGLRDGDFEVLHVSGRRDHAELAAGPLRAGYHLIEYLDPQDFASALSAADLAVARAGGSVMEIAAHGLPAILVPYPHAAGDHQRANARFMQEAGAAVAIDERDLSGSRLARTVRELLGDRERMGRMAEAARSLARPDAAEAIAAEILEAARA